MNCDLLELVTSMILKKHDIIMSLSTIEFCFQKKLKPSIKTKKVQNILHKGKNFNRDTFQMKELFPFLYLAYTI